MTKFELARTAGRWRLRSRTYVALAILFVTAWPTNADVFHDAFTVRGPRIDAVTDRPELARQGSPICGVLEFIPRGARRRHHRLRHDRLHCIPSAKPGLERAQSAAQRCHVETPPDETSSTSLSLSPSSKPENASEVTSVGLPARYIQNEPCVPKT